MFGESFPTYFAAIAKKQIARSEKSLSLAEAAQRENAWRAILISCLLALVTVAVYWPVRHHEFLNYDDNLYVTGNEHVQAGLTMEGIRWAFAGDPDDQTYWHPITWLSHMMDFQLFGLNAGAHHLVNVFIHIAAALALFWVFWRMTGALWPSAFVAGLFALHPLQVDTVAWAAERKSALSAFFWMITLGAYGHYARRPSPARYAAVLVMFALGLMTKPMLVTLPCVLLLLDVWPLQRLDLVRKSAAARRETGTEAQWQPARAATLARLVGEKVPLFGLAAVSSTITLLAHQRLQLVVSTDQFPLGTRLANALVSYVRYLGKMIWPGDLAIHYPYVGDWAWWQVTGAVLLLACVTILVLWLWRTRPYLPVGWFWFVGTLVPVIGLVQVSEQSMADRFAYVPLIGCYLMLAWGVADLSAQWRHRAVLLTAAAVLVLSACAVRTASQLRHWRNSATLFAHALQVTTNNVTAHFNLGIALAEEGKAEEALTHLRSALQLKPNFAEVHGMIGRTLAAQGKWSEAVASYREALHWKPDLPEALNNLAWILATHPDPQLRNGAEATALAERACELTRRKKAVMLGTLAAAYAEASRFPEAIKTAENARQLALSSGETNLAARNQELLELYRKGQPYHEGAP